MQGGGQEMAVMAKFLIATIQVNLCCLLLGFGTKSCLKILPLAYHHSNFLAATLFDANHLHNQSENYWLDYST